MKHFLTFSILLCSITFVVGQEVHLAFQAFNTQGDNLMHVTTADFDGVGAKDYVVAMTVEGKVIAFQGPEARELFREAA